MIVGASVRWSSRNQIELGVQSGKNGIAALAGCTVHGKRRGRRKGAVQAYSGEGDER
jgi:hypothetical protein